MSNELDFNLGHSTAYAYAKASGDLPEGMTPEEYGELLAAYATVGQTAVNAKNAAVAANTAAQTAATTATNKASEATTAAQTATTKAGEAVANAEAAARDASQAMAAESVATSKATEATTAAATAVSAKDDAVTANTAAQSAKTAAQTAQTGAETAAASVQESAAQIATNTSDIGELKNTLTNTEELIGYEKVTLLPNLENGTISLSNKAISYTDSPYSIRTPEGTSFLLPIGTNISLIDPDEIYLFNYRYTKNGTDWYGVDNVTTHTVSGEMKYVFSVRRKDWGTSFPDLNVLKIELPAIDGYDISSIYKKNIDLKSILISGYSLPTYYNGRLNVDAACETSKLIPIKSGEKVFFRSYEASTSMYSLCFYTLSESDGFTFVSGISNGHIGVNETSFTATQDGYIRICNAVTFADCYAYFDVPIPDKTQLYINSVRQIMTDNVTGTDYMQTAIDRITGELKAKSELGNIVTFGFSTDQHIKDDDDATYTLPVLRGLQALSKLTQAYPYDFVCLGGDACEAGAYATTPALILDECVTIQKPLHDALCPIVPIAGNHDAAQNNANITGEMLFNAHFKRIANSGFLKGWDNSHTNGYWDSEAHKIRFIFLDDTLRTDYTYAQRSAALALMLTDVPEGYKIVIFSHHPISSALTNAKWADALGLQNIINPYASKIICCICGHSHIDISETSDGILYIATTLAMYGHDQDGNRGTLDTETETAFDTFVIDQQNQHIYALRYGHGSNRDWSYTLT